MKSRWFARVDYTGRTDRFIRNASKRYRFWGLKDTLFAIPGLILLALGGASTVRGMAEKYFGPEGQANALIADALFFSLLVILGFVLGWSDWKKRNAVIMTEIRRMKSELMNR